MNTIPKPRPIAFMFAGYDVADALAILEKWETLSDDQIEALGLGLKRLDNVGEADGQSNVLRPSFGKTGRDFR